MYNFFKRKTVIAVSLTIIAAIICTAVFGKNDPFTNGVRVIFSPILSAASAVTEKIAVLKAYFVQVDAYREENERLVRENTELRQKEKSAAQFRKENERLNSLLKLSNELSDYNTVAAKVVSYEPNNWYDTIVINKGKGAGIEKDDIVINSDGVVGKISDSGANWSHITSVLSSENAISTVVPRTGEIAVTEGDIKLSANKLCKLSFVNSSAQISEGDFLETSGAVGLYPAGLSIGTVKETSIDANGTKYGVVEPSVKFESLYEVLVIKQSK